MTSETFQFKKGTRQGVSLFISIAGPSGSGKTLSALKLARGLAGGHPDMDPKQLEKIDQTIAAIDTEAGRILHYAPGRGELPGPNRFAVSHGDLHAPFSGESYLAAINAAEEAGFKVIVIDSFSHIWEGEGGAKDLHKALVAEAVVKAEQRHKRYRNSYPFDPIRAADAASVTAWDAAKAGYKAVLRRINQLRAHVIVCLRAEEKLQIIVDKDEQTGREKTRYVHTKDLPEAQRWVPLIEHRFHYDPIMSLVLSPTTPGVPHPIKLQEQHRAAIRLDQPISEESGLALARWAAGDPVELPPQEPAKPAQAKAQPRRSKFEENLYRVIDTEGEAGLKRIQKAVTNPSQQEFLAERWEDLLERARAADAKGAGSKPEPALPGL